VKLNGTLLVIEPLIRVSMTVELPPESDTLMLIG
jgi:hypothetical protein